MPWNYIVLGKEHKFVCLQIARKNNGHYSKVTFV